MNKKLWAEVAEIQKDFAYTALHDSEDSVLQGWQCGKPNTNIFSFEIVIGSYGIYMSGDIDSLHWPVNRTIGFLAGNDIDYYIHTKLDTCYKDLTEFDEEARDTFLAERLASWMEDNKNVLDRLLSDLAAKELGYTLKDVPLLSEEMQKVLDVKDNLYPIYIDEMNKALNLNGDLNKIVELLEKVKIHRVREADSIWDAYESLKDVDNEQDMQRLCFELLEYYDDPTDFGKISHRIQFPLYMTCYAARKIVRL